MIAKKGLRVYTKPINILTNNNNNNMETRNVEIKDPETAKRFIGGRNVEIKDPKTAKWVICGPITGYDVEERRKEFERAVQLIRMGYGNVAIFNPLKNGLPEDASYSDNMMCALEHLVDSDVVMFLPGWEESRGCLNVLKFARRLNLQIFGLTFITEAALDRYIESHPLNHHQ